MAQAPYTLTRLDGTEFSPVYCESCEGFHAPEDADDYHDDERGSAWVHDPTAPNAWELWGE